MPAQRKTTDANTAMTRRDVMWLKRNKELERVPSERGRA